MFMRVWIWRVTLKYQNIWVVKPAKLIQIDTVGLVVSEYVFPSSFEIVVTQLQKCKLWNTMHKPTLRRMYSELIFFLVCLPI